MTTLHNVNVFTYFAEKMCSPIKLKEKSTINVDTGCPNATTYSCQYGETVMIQCIQGYETSTGQTNVTLTCQADKTYDKTPPTCQSIICQFLFQV
jgi:hypothetical protein